MSSPGRVEMKNSNSLYFKMINRLIICFNHCRNVVLYTKRKNNKKRTNFPKKEVQIFSKDLNEIIIIINNLSDNKLLIAIQLCESLIVISNSLKKGDLEAFNNILSSLEWMVMTVINQQINLDNLIQENIELKMLIQKLEIDLANFDNTSNISNTGISVEDNVVEDAESVEISSKNDNEKINLINIIKESILYSIQININVIDIFIGVSEFDIYDKRLVVLYKGFSDFVPAQCEYVIWKNINENRLHLLYTDYLEKNWIAFKSDHFTDYQQLLVDFLDINFTNVINNYSDVVSIYPSVIKELSNFKSVFIIQKKCCYYHVYGEDKIPLLKDDYFLLSSGRKIKLIFEDGWYDGGYMKSGIVKSGIVKSGTVKSGTMKPETMKSGTMKSENLNSSVFLPNNSIQREKRLMFGDGISLKYLKDYGTIGGFVYKDNNRYILTNEHIVKTLNEKSVLSNKLSLISPSFGPRMNEIIKDQHFNQNPSRDITFLEVLLDNRSNIKLKRAINENFIMSNSQSQVIEITLQEIYNYLHDSQIEIIINKDNVLNITKLYDTNLFSENLQISGNISLIAINSDILTESIKVDRIVTLEDIWNLGQQIKVTKKGASSGFTVGLISRPAHVKDYFEGFLSEYRGDILKPRVLYNQILVAQVDGPFGTFGDSGSLVYIDSEDGIIVIGVFVGKLNENDNFFVVSPAEILLKEGFGFI